jgi:hypothetical protein
VNREPHNLTVLVFTVWVVAVFWSRLQVTVPMSSFFADEWLSPLMSFVEDPPQESANQIESSETEDEAVGQGRE